MASGAPSGDIATLGLRLDASQAITEADRWERRMDGVAATGKKVERGQTGALIAAGVFTPKVEGELGR